MELEKLLHYLNFAVENAAGGISHHKQMAYAEGFLDCLRYLEMITLDRAWDVMQDVDKVIANGKPNSSYEGQINSNDE